MLYNLFMDYAMRVYMDRCKAEGIKFFQMKFKIRTTATTRGERRGVYYGEHTIDWSGLGYADDLMLVFKSEEELQRALLIPNETFERFHFQINVGKTKTMVLNFKQVDGNQCNPDTVCFLCPRPYLDIGLRYKLEIWHEGSTR